MNAVLTRLSTQPISGRPAIGFLRDLLKYCERLSSAPSENVEDAEDGLTESIARYVCHLQDPAIQAWATALAPVLIDLSRQGWTLTYDKNHIWGISPEASSDRETLRFRFHVQRNQQLTKPSVVAFLNKMEQWRSHLGRRKSVLSLLRDGRDLATAVVEASSEQPAVKPYIQFVTPTARCDYTGLRLQDVWRYFRHTWANPYGSIPGRSLQMIVRDAAAYDHPIIGIAALSSAAVRLGPRDRYIGWDTDQVVSAMAAAPAQLVKTWARRVVDQAINEIYTVDLVREGALPSDNRAWTAKHLPELRKISMAARELHHRMMNKKAYNADDPRRLPDEQWAAIAELPLFQAKRAEQLAGLIELRIAVASLDASVSPALRLREALLERIVRIARSKTVGTEIADLTICGAVAPYSHLAAGKLVALLAVSPAAVEEYHRRYSGLPSTIASSVAGRAITRAANLVYVGTTSLYGKRPNQYDRLSMPANIVGGCSNDAIRYQHIRDLEARRTYGVGTFHFSSETLQALEKFVSATQGGWRVNNVFGEGTSQKLRGLRDGLTALGLDADQLLVHGIEKCIYGVRLASNVDRYLLGLDDKPHWLFDPTALDGGVARVSQWWEERWAKGRIARQDVLDRVRGETLVHPIRHRGRVPRFNTSTRQNSLFDSGDVAL